MSDQGYYPSFQTYVSSTDSLPFTLASPVIIPSAYSVYLGVVEAQFPVCNYNCTGASIQFKYQITGESDVRDFTLAFADGNYDANEIAAMFAWSGLLTGTVGSHQTIGAHYLPNQNKFQVVATVRGLNFFRMVPSPFAAKLGFTLLSYDPDNSFYYLTNWISDRQADLSSTRNYYVNTNYTTVNTANRTNCVAKIPVSARYGEMVHWKNPNGFGASIYDRVLYSFDITITDDQGEVVDFQNVPWSLTLQIDIKSPDPAPPVLDMVDPALNIEGLPLPPEMMGN